MRPSLLIPESSPLPVSETPLNHIQLQVSSFEALRWMKAKNVHRKPGDEIPQIVMPTASTMENDSARPRTYFESAVKSSDRSGNSRLKLRSIAPCAFLLSLRTSVPVNPGFKESASVPSRTCHAHKRRRNSKSQEMVILKGKADRSGTRRRRCPSSEMDPRYALDRLIACIQSQRSKTPTNRAQRLKERTGRDTKTLR